MGIQRGVKKCLYLVQVIGSAMQKYWIGKKKGQERTSNQLWGKIEISTMCNEKSISTMWEYDCCASCLTAPLQEKSGENIVFR